MGVTSFVVLLVAYLSCILNPFVESSVHPHSHLIDSNAPRCEFKDNLVCDHVEDYPKERIERLVADHVARGLLIPGPSRDPELMLNRPYTMSNSNEERMCDSIRRMVFPVTPSGKANNSQYIVQSSRLMQPIVSEECSAGRTEGCSKKVQVPNLYETFCHQTHGRVRMIVYDQEADALKSQDFLFPSCCECRIRDKNSK